MANTGADQTAVWAYGGDGWYCARSRWVESYAEELRALGYRVVRSVKKPTEE